VAIAFTRALVANEKLKVLTTAEQVASGFLETADRRYQAGDIPILEVNLAKNGAARAHAELGSGRAELVTSLGELRVLLGMSPEEEFPVAGDLTSPKKYDLTALATTALNSVLDAGLILASLPVAFVGSIVPLLLSGETWKVSSLVGLIGLFGIAVQNGLVLVTQTRSLVDQGRTFEAAVREASIGRVRPKIMRAATAILGLLPILFLRLHGTEIERPLP
jgi:hypothetical protein